MNSPEQLKKFQDFVLTFGDNFEGKGAQNNYAKFTGFSKATISKYINNKEKIHEVHFTIMRLVNEREEAKRSERKTRNELKKQMRQV